MEVRLQARTGALWQARGNPRGHWVRPFGAPAAPRVARPCLQAVFDALNDAYFHGACCARIGWSRAGPPKRRGRRSMLLGSYSEQDCAIRIHPALAAPFVPDYVLRMVVFHEMLHEIFGTPLIGRRRRVHPPEFVAVEQSHPDYARARAWEQQHLTQLLRVRA